MASYLPSQVDHSLYNPILPQTNVSQVFELLQVKQNLYNQNLARINTNLSSMSDLANSVTNENTKNKINEYNKVAQDNLRKYSNLDFSIADNIKAIDNIYTPLLKDKDFITDYSATSHLQNQMQVGFAKRDSDKKDERDEFSATNMQYVTDGFYDLQNAKNSKDLKMAASSAGNRYYSPYSDYGKHLSDYMKAYDAKVVRSSASGGYIVKVTNGGKTDSYGLEKFLDLVLSDHDKNQIKIESRVAIDGLIRQQGIDKVTTDYIQESIDNTKFLTDQYSKELTKKNSEIDSLPSAENMDDSHREALNSLIDERESIEKKINSLKNKNEEISNIHKRLSDGTFSYNDFADLLASEVADEKKGLLTRTLAANYLHDHSEMDINSDPTYIANQTNQREYAKMAQGERFHSDEMANKALDRIKDYTIAGFELDENGNPILSSLGGVKQKNASIQNDPFSYVQGLISEGNLNDKELTDYRTTVINTFSSVTGRNPTPDQLNILNNPNHSLKNWDPAIYAVQQEYNRNKGLSKSNSDFAKQELQTELNKYNKLKGTNLTIDDILKPEDAGGGYMGAIGDAFKLGYNYITNPIHTANERINKALGSEYSGKEVISDHGAKRSQAIKDFKASFNKEYSGNLSALLTEGAATQSSKAGRVQFDKYIAGPLGSFITSNPTAELGGLNKLQGNKDASSDVLNEAYEIVKHLSVDSKSLPYTFRERKNNGTKIQFPSANWNDVYPISYEKATDAQKEAFKLITGKGICIPIADVQYSTEDLEKGAIFAGKQIQYSGYKTIYLKGEAFITPTEGNYHYYPTNSKNGVNMITLTQDGNYELVKSNRRINIGNLEDINYRATIEEYNRRKSVVETPKFKKSLKLFIETHKDLLQDEGNGQWSLPDTYIETLIRNSK